MRHPYRWRIKRGEQYLRAAMSTDPEEKQARSGTLPRAGTQDTPGSGVSLERDKDTLERISEKSLTAQGAGRAYETCRDAHAGPEAPFFADPCGVQGVRKPPCCPSLEKPCGHAGSRAGPSRCFSFVSSFPRHHQSGRSGADGSPPSRASSRTDCIQFINNPTDARALSSSDYIS